MYYGWVIVLVSMVALAATSPGQSYLIGKFNQAIEADLGISETTLTAVYGFATLAAAGLLPVVGILSDRWGPRRIMGLAALGLGAGCVLIGFTHGPIALGCCYFLLRFAGQGALGLSASHSTAMWFEKRLGTVTGFKSFAMPIAILALAPLTTWLIREMGWRLAYPILGIGVWVVVLPLVFFLHRNRPEEIGQVIDGEYMYRRRPTADGASHPESESTTEADANPMALQRESQSPVATALHQDEPRYTRAESMRTLAYWLIAAAMTLNGVVGTVFVFLLDEMAEARGLPPRSADALLSVLAIGMGVSAPLSGILTDRVRPRWLLSSGSALLGLACANFALAESLLVAQFAMIWLAMSQSLVQISGGTLMARFFGRPHHGAIRSSVTFLVVIGTALGPFLASWSAQYMTYAGALMVFAALAMGLAVAGLRLNRPVPRRISDSESEQTEREAEPTPDSKATRDELQG